MASKLSNEYVAGTRQNIDAIGRSKLPLALGLDWLWADALTQERSRSGALRELERLLYVTYEIIAGEIKRQSPPAPRQSPGPSIFEVIANEQ